MGRLVGPFSMIVGMVGPIWGRWNPFDCRKTQLAWVSFEKPPKRSVLGEDVEKKDVHFIYILISFPFFFDQEFSRWMVSRLWLWRWLGGRSRRMERCKRNDNNDNNDTSFPSGSTSHHEVHQSLWPCKSFADSGEGWLVRGGVEMKGLILGAKEPG